MKKVVIVTGGNRGLGLETCKQLAQKDFKVVFTARDEKKGKEAVKKLEKMGLEVDFHRLDVTKKRSITSLFKYLKKRYGKVDVLVNNAGVHFDRFRGLLKADLDTMRKNLRQIFMVLC